MVEANRKYEVVIGLEVHAQLLTRSKMFCSCPSDYIQSAPNTVVCPVCLGMPGTLPVINSRAVEYVIMTGLALNSEIFREHPVPSQELSLSGPDEGLSDFPV